MKTITIPKIVLKNVYKVNFRSYRIVKRTMNKIEFDEKLDFASNTPLSKRSLFRLVLMSFETQVSFQIFAKTWENVLSCVPIWIQ